MNIKPVKFATPVLVIFHKIANAMDFSWAHHFGRIVFLDIKQLRRWQMVFG